MQTGNTVYFVLGLVGAEGDCWVKSGVSIAGFCVGSLCFAAFHRLFSPRQRWVLCTSFLVQMTCVTVAAIIATVYRPGRDAPLSWLVLIPLALVAFQRSGQDDWLGLEEDVRDWDLLKTPTLSDFVGRGAAGRSRAKKSLHKRAETLRQEDFWGFAYDKDPPQNKMSDIRKNQSSVDAEVHNTVSPMDKPLPPPPAGEMNKASEVENLDGFSKPDLLKKQASAINISPVRREKSSGPVSGMTQPSPSTVESSTPSPRP